MSLMRGYLLSDLDYNNIRDTLNQMKDLVGENSLDMTIIDEMMEVLESASPIVVGFDKSLAD